MTKAASRYAITYDDATQILHLTLRGVWSPPTFSAFGAALMLKAALLKVQGKPYDVLSDSREFGVQSGIVAAGFERIMGHAAKSPVGYMAIVVGSKLNVVQAEEVLQHERLRVFEDMDEAREWLLSHRLPRVDP